MRGKMLDTYPLLFDGRLCGCSIRDWSGGSQAGCKDACNDVEAHFEKGEKTGAWREIAQFSEDLQGICCCSGGGL